MQITIVGSSSCIPDVGTESACFIIDGKHLVDTGWCAALKMREYGFDPLSLESIILTHLHQDHFIGLPQLLFSAGLRKQQRKSAEPLHIIGPGQHLARVVAAAFDFLQVYRFPQLSVDYRLVPLNPGDSCELPGLRLETTAARHASGHDQPEMALVYKATGRNDGECFAFTGDTHYHPPIAQFVQGVPLLIHDGAHTAAKDAANIAKIAGVGQLVLTHYLQASAPQLLAEAQAVFANTVLAVAGESFTVQSP